MDILKISVLGAAGVLGNRSCDTGISGREDQLSVPVPGETETESPD